MLFVVSFFIDHEHYCPAALPPGRILSAPTGAVETMRLQQPTEYTPSASLRSAAFNRGMIATGNHHFERFAALCNTPGGSQGGCAAGGRLIASLARAEQFKLPVESLPLQVDLGQIPQEVGSQLAQHQHQQETADHGKVFQAGEAIQHSQNNGTGNGGNGIDVLAENVGHLAGHDVPQCAAAYSGDEAQKANEKIVVRIPCPHTCHDPIHRKGSQPQGIEPEQQLVIQGSQFAGHMTMPVHQQEHNVRHNGGCQHIKRIAEHHGRCYPDDQVAHQSAAAGGGDGKNVDTENIHLLANADKSPGNSEGNGADQVEKREQCNRHIASSKGKIKGIIAHPGGKHNQRENYF